MNKFTVSVLPKSNDELPVLYKVKFADKYYVHKGKKLKDSLDRFLDDVDRGMRGKSCPPDYSEVVKYCLKYPAIHKVSVEVLVNSDPEKILRKETSMRKSMKNDENSLNRADIEPYKPEWMVKQALQKRCENPITEGIVNGKKMKFKFCPNCGRLNPTNK